MARKLIARGGGNEVGRSCYDFGDFVIDRGVLLPEKRGGKILTASMPQDEIAFLLLTHAHLDHVGDVISLAREQPRMRIFATLVTKMLVELQLHDSYRIGVEQREKEEYRGLRPQPLLYEEEEIQPFLDRIEVVENEGWFEPAPGYKVSFRGAGHIKGAAYICIVTPEGLRIVHACDLSLDDQAFVRAARVPKDFLNPDMVVVEATHGALLEPLPDRADAHLQTVEITKRVWERGGKLLIPQFGISGSQIVDPIAKAGYPVVLDGAMRDCAWIFQNAPQWCEIDVPIVAPLPTYLGRNEVEEKYQRRDRDFREALAKWPGPGIVACTPGMMELGLSVFYAEEWLKSSNNAILFTGYLADDTAGRKISQIQKGEPVVFHHEPQNPNDDPWDVKCPVNCEVYTVRESGHSDPWKMVRNFILPLNPKKVVTVHGSPEAHAGMKKHINEALPGVEVVGAINNEPIPLI